MAKIYSWIAWLGISAEPGSIKFERDALDFRFIYRRGDDDYRNHLFYYIVADSAACYGRFNAHGF